MALAQNPTEWLRQCLKGYADDSSKQLKTQDDCYAFKKWCQAILDQWSKDVGKVENLSVTSQEIAATFQEYAITTVLTKVKRMPTDHDSGGSKESAVVGYMLWMLKAMRDEFDRWLPSGITAMGSMEIESSGNTANDKPADGGLSKAGAMAGPGMHAPSMGLSMGMGMGMKGGPVGGSPGVDKEAICKEALAETLGTTLSRWVGTAEDIASLTKGISAGTMSEWATEALKILSNDSLTALATRDGESMAHYLTRTSERMKHIDEKGSDPEKPFKNWIIAKLKTMETTADVATVTAQWMQNGSSPEGSPYKAWIALENLNSDMGKVCDEVTETNVSDFLEIHYQAMSRGFDKWLGEYRDFLREIRKSFQAKESFRKNYAKWNYSVEWSTPRDDKIADYKKSLIEGSAALEKLQTKTVEGFKQGKKNGVVTDDQVSSVSSMFEKTKPLIQEAIDAVEGKK
ncbi:hypothetical protein HIM_03763 [Hirsutella minnesotensis 3608]|uniref:Uncharacterized protein n=1 Tax=Hirsutella minnesotensis 3608 TaxID=1043627 RepID=A0A0F7ZM18_9HYPO|nr:hypothetical protein HIM_03763 [Hirsutella minnesotensis 3608]